MTKFDYAALMSTADQLVGKFGQSMTLNRTTTDFDPDTLISSSNVTSYAVNGIDLALTRTADNAMANDTLVEENRRKVVLSAESFSIRPKSGDELIIGSDSWTIVGATTSQPAGEPIVHVLEITR